MGPHCPSPSAPPPEKPQGQWPCSSSATPACPLAVHTDLLSTDSGLLASAFSCICSLYLFLPKGDICRLQTAEKRSLGVAQSPKQAQSSCARPPEQSTPQNCVIDLPHSLKSLMAAGTAEPAVGWGHRPVPAPSSLLHLITARSIPISAAPPQLPLGISCH